MGDLAVPGKKRGGGGLRSSSWKKGQITNPKGRPRDDNEVKVLAKQYTKEAINKLVYWMQYGNGKISVSACIALLDRGWGRPAQQLLDEHGIPLRLNLTNNDTEL